MHQLLLRRRSSASDIPPPDIATTAIAGGGVSGEQVPALAADVAGEPIPFVTGGGAAVRVASKGDDVVDAAQADP